MRSASVVHAESSMTEPLGPASPRGHRHRRNMGANCHPSIADSHYGTLPGCDLISAHRIEASYYYMPDRARSQYECFR